MKTTLQKSGAGPAAPVWPRNRHRCASRSALVWLGIVAGVFGATAQEVRPPFEFRQFETRYNYQQHLSQPPPAPATVEQFRTFTTFGGVLTNPATATLGSVVQLEMRSARIGNPIVGSTVSYQFGEVIRLPDTDEYGVDLDVPNPDKGRPAVTTAEAYWRAEPYTTNKHAGDAFGDGYYWSPHAEKAYATQAGILKVSWQKAAVLTAPPNPLPPDTRIIAQGGFNYLVYTKSGTVSASAVKTPRRMYWTEGQFTQIGRPISVPTDRVKDIKIVYHNRFPEFTDLRPMVVTNVIGVNGTTPIEQTNTLFVRWEWPFDGTMSGTIAITNTLWYDRTLNTLRAYNVQESRVFVELLGDKRGDFEGRTIHQQLGYEIVEVIQRPRPADVRTELGERLEPFRTPAEAAGKPALFADPILNLGQEFVYRHSVAGTPEFDYYAVRETRNQADYQMHWMEEGLQGLRWPYLYVRYAMVWPVDVAKYSHYVRPPAATEAEARATAVALPAQNAPQLVYQDPLDQPRGKLTENFAYYSILDADHPAHRALLQFTAGEHVRFERVFSWLDSSLRNNTPAAPTVGTATFSANFASAPAGAKGYGSATVSDGVLHLTDAANFQEGTYVLDEFAPNGEEVESFKATFKVRLSDSTGIISGNARLPGDGFSFNFGTLPDGPLAGAAAVEGIADGVTVSFDLWDDGDNDYAPGIQIKLNGAHVAAVRMAKQGSEHPSAGILPTPLDPATAPVIPAGTKGVLREVYANISGSDVASLAADPQFPGFPSQVTIGSAAFEAPANAADNYGQRLRALLTPPTTGLYRFAIASDDASELYLSTDELPAHRVRIAAQPNWTAEREFLKDPAQISAPIELQAGRSYYIEALMKESGGEDNLSVTWQPPGAAAIVNGSLPIPGDFLVPYGEARPMTLTTGPEFVPVEIELSPGGLMDISYKGVKVLQNIRTGYQARRGRFGFAARTGGANSTHWIDDLNIALNPPPPPRSFVTDFAAAAGGVLHGDAAVRDGFLHLTDAVDWQNGTYLVDDFSESGRDPVDGFRAAFKVRLSDSTGIIFGNTLYPGDGFSFNFGNVPNGSIAPGDEGISEGLVVSFDIWDNGPDDYAPGIKVRYDGVQKAAVRMAGADIYADTGGLDAPIDPATGQPMTLMTGPQFVPVGIELKAGGLVDVSYKGVKVLENVATGYTPRSGRFAFAARTGGANSTHWIDDLSIVPVTGGFVVGTGFASSVATNLNSWFQGGRGFFWPDPGLRPRVVAATVDVGRRIAAPLGELGERPDTNYFAGYLQASQGNAYHATAYVDPFVAGFDVASQGAIIPVNKIPGNDLLEVWWFRRNAVDRARGFQNVHWPSVIGRYTIDWPTDASEIILAGNDGSRPLPSLEAKGTIYVQNNAALPGYNPNEEHALMQGGQAYALRDDLNLTGTTIPAVFSGPAATYSSAPFVLLEYTAEDGRLAIRPFRVVREKPAAGITFEYQKRAAQILQPPMPLPLLGVAFAPKLAGVPRQGLNTEYIAWTIKASTTGTGIGNLVTESTHGFLPYWTLALQDPSQNPPAERWFFATNTTDDAVEGVVSLTRPLSVSPVANGQNADGYTFVIADPRPAANSIPAGSTALLALPASAESIPVTLPLAGPDADGKVTVAFGTTPASIVAPWTSASEATLVVALGGLADNALKDWRLGWNQLPQTTSDPTRKELYSKATYTDRKGNVWVYRGPHRADQPESFNMRFYYNTLPGFFFPTLALGDQPPVGTVTPYLRKKNPQGQFVGDPVHGNRNADQADDQNALPITYHPYWPEDAPVLQMAETLTTPKRGLPAVRGQTSLEVLYQQSQIGLNGGQLTIDKTQTSVVLHDPTREKAIALAADDLPKSIRTETSRGKVYFPNLPPHLVKRFWFDPNRGAKGMLVYRGEFVDAPLGDKYLLLNVAGEKDTKALKNLCDPNLSDPKKTVWDTAIAALATPMERFVENPAVPGTYIPHPTEAPVSIALGEVAEVTDDDVAVDSYALTAVGPETGYVTLIAGNGAAFTPVGEPVSMEVIRVAPNLYRGEVVVIEAENPLSETLTLQQVVDLAGQAENYNFEWRITAPVDGQPPVTYTRERWPTGAAPAPLTAWWHVRYPLPTDRAANIESVPASRRVEDISDAVIPVSELQFETVRQEGDLYRFTIAPSSLPHRLAVGNRLTMSSSDGATAVHVQVQQLPSGNEVIVSLQPGQTATTTTLSADQIARLSEQIVQGQPQSIAFSSFTVAPEDHLTEVWISLKLALGLGAKVHLNGGLVATIGFAEAGANTLPDEPPSQLAGASGRTYFRLPPSTLSGAIPGLNGSKTNRLAVEFFAPAVPNAPLNFQMSVEGIQSVDRVASGTVWIPLDTAQYEDGVRAILGENADVQSLGDNYLTMRYRPKADANGWSQWTEPQLAEGWIKRVLKGINPFNQRLADLYNNAVNTDVSILSQAGPRWEGNVALNLESMNNYGLIEIYETVLNRGKNLSIHADINYGPANDALLLAAGYINDLYMLLGNEAAADAANPTIGIGTADNTYGEIATALFSFKGQLPSLLAEELALLRGRDDFLVPGVQTRPVYNRMVWNYTRGIDAGEVVYALNYNILDQNTDGKVDALDALRLYPQGHGDAYGHYLTALKGYYHLLLNPNFDWVPRSEAVLVLGKPVSVDYQDERKFAAAAGALARTGKQIFDLTWRQDYKSGSGQGWEHFRPTRSSSQGRTRQWGMDHWAARTAGGAYLNWVVGNAILPFQDPDSTHADTIQQVDRTTVPELKELSAVLGSVQVALDNAEAGLTPMGLPEDAVPFDLNPLSIANGPFTHFEQIYQRAKDALNNAVVAFDDAKDVTRLMRSEEDSLAELRAQVAAQELAYTNSLIELFGTPYPEDIGPGRTYRTGFAGPDTIHYMYIDNVELNFNGLLDPAADTTWRIDTQTFTRNWLNADGISEFNFIQPARNGAVDGTDALEDWLANKSLYVEFNLASHGFFQKPKTWVGRRVSPGRIQQAISDIAKARNAAYNTFYWADAAKYDLDWAIQSFQRKKASHQRIRDLQSVQYAVDQAEQAAKLAFEIFDAVNDSQKLNLEKVKTSAISGIPTSLIAGLAAGGDMTSAARAAINASVSGAEIALDIEKVVRFSVLRGLEYGNQLQRATVEFDKLAPEEWAQELREAMGELRDKVYGMNNRFMEINQALQELDDAQRNYRTLLAEGDRLQAEREIFRQRSAAIIQGYRTRDAAFRIFRNEKLERYKALFDLAAKYTFMAAQAYDYDTGLLGTTQGREFINRIVQVRALGVIQNGSPQFAGSNTGDPGLSSVLAEMFGDWSVVKSRLGFNNPDAYGTTVSLRTENYRILPGTNSDPTWKQVLTQGRKDNILDDPDVRRYCMQIDDGTGLPVPGIVIDFGTTIAKGLNLFGRPLAGGDHYFSPSTFATKVFAVGVSFEGYLGMDNPGANADAIEGAGGETPPDPDLAFLDPARMAATPYIYLIPVGVDSMRSPPLGDVSTIRTWNVQDVTIPLPFNIGGSDFSSKRFWQTADSLSEPLFNVRKHQAFRPISDATLWDENTIYSTGGELWHNKFTNTRLIGRSVWNSQWKLVIPGHTLLNNPDEGLERFLQSVHDIKLYFHTYSYSGN